MVHPIYMMAVITTVLALAGVGGLLRWKAPVAERDFLLLLVVAEIPMCALALYLVRLPLLDAAVRQVVGVNNPAYLFISMFYAPLTEEPAKIWLLMFPLVRRGITRDNFWRVALALGLGFGVGELWLVAHTVAVSPSYDGIPWYQFTGFLNERIMVCLLHGCFVSLTLFFFTRGRFLLGLGLAMLAHLFCNFPIYLMLINFAGLGARTWGTIAVLWVPTYFLAGIVLLAYFATGGLKVGQFIFGNSICPGCHKEYPSPLLGLNLVTRRYERCPLCRKWHLVSSSRRRPAAAAAKVSPPVDPPAS